MEFLNLIKEILTAADTFKRLEAKVKQDKVKQDKIKQEGKREGMQGGNFETAKIRYYEKLTMQKLTKLIELLNDISKRKIFESKFDSGLSIDDVERMSEIKELLQSSYNNRDIEKTSKILFDNLEFFEQMEKKKQILISDKINFSKLPKEIRDEIMYDLKELETCYYSRAYRAATILCGRILEICLHRKYYEITNIDLLEKAPGIGLGSLVAKLKEKGINIDEIDPALMQQIHLINQARVAAVHKKNFVFFPSKEQIEAIMLYTADLIKKLFP